MAYKNYRKRSSLVFVQKQFQFFKLAIHSKLKKLDLNEVGMNFDATSLCSSAMWDKLSVYPKLESGFAFKSHMNDVYLEAFHNQTLSKMVMKVQF